MLSEFSRKVFLAVGKTDLRRGIDGLAAIVQGQFELNPFSEALFLFCGTRKDRIKGLLWESVYPFIFMDAIHYKVKEDH